MVIEVSAVGTIVTNGVASAPEVRLIRCVVRRPSGREESCIHKTFEERRKHIATYSDIRILHFNI